MMMGSGSGNPHSGSRAALWVSSRDSSQSTREKASKLVFGKDETPSGQFHYPTRAGEASGCAREAQEYVAYQGSGTLLWTSFLSREANLFREPICQRPSEGVVPQVSGEGTRGVDPSVDQIVESCADSGGKNRSNAAAEVLIGRAHQEIDPLPQNNSQQKQGSEPGLGNGSSRQRTYPSSPAAGVTMANGFTDGSPSQAANIRTCDLVKENNSLAGLLDLNKLPEGASPTRGTEGLSASRGHFSIPSLACSEPQSNPVVGFPDAQRKGTGALLSDPSLRSGGTSREFSFGAGGVSSVAARAPVSGTASPGSWVRAAASAAANHGPSRYAPDQPTTPICRPAFDLASSVTSFESKVGFASWQAEGSAAVRCGAERKPRGGNKDERLKVGDEEVVETPSQHPAKDDISQGPNWTSDREGEVSAADPAGKCQEYKSQPFDMDMVVEGTLAQFFGIDQGSCAKKPAEVVFQEVAQWWRRPRTWQAGRLRARQLARAIVTARRVRAAEEGQEGCGGKSRAAGGNSSSGRFSRDSRKRKQLEENLHVAATQMGELQRWDPSSRDLAARWLCWFLRTIRSAAAPPPSEASSSFSPSSPEISWRPPIGHAWRLGRQSWLRVVQLSLFSTLCAVLPKMQSSLVGAPLDQHTSHQQQAGGSLRKRGLGTAQQQATQPPSKQLLKTCHAILTAVHKSRCCFCPLHWDVLRVSVDHCRDLLERAVECAKKKRLEPKQHPLQQELECKKGAHLHKFHHQKTLGEKIWTAVAAPGGAATAAAVPAAAPPVMVRGDAEEEAPLPAVAALHSMYSCSAAPGRRGMPTHRGEGVEGTTAAVLRPVSTTVPVPTATPEPGATAAGGPSNHSVPASEIFGKHAQRTNAGRKRDSVHSVFNNLFTAAGAMPTAAPHHHEQERQELSQRATSPIPPVPLRRVVAPPPPPPLFPVGAWPGARGKAAAAPTTHAPVFSTARGAQSVSSDEQEGAKEIEEADALSRLSSLLSFKPYSASGAGLHPPSNASRTMHPTPAGLQFHLSKTQLQQGEEKWQPCAGSHQSSSAPPVHHPSIRPTSAAPSAAPSAARPPPLSMAGQGGRGTPFSPRTASAVAAAAAAAAAAYEYPPKQGVAPSRERVGAPWVSEGKGPQQQHQQWSRQPEEKVKQPTGAGSVWEEVQGDLPWPKRSRNAMEFPQRDSVLGSSTRLAPRGAVGQERGQGYGSKLGDGCIPGRAVTFDTYPPPVSANAGPSSPLSPQSYYHEAPLHSPISPPGATAMSAGASPTRPIGGLAGSLAALGSHGAARSRKKQMARR